MQLVRRSALVLLAALVIAAGAGSGKVDGTFKVAGKDAQLKHVRAKRVKLDEKGKPGYAVLLSAKPASGDIESWRTAQPSERGSFIYVLFEPKGDIWVAELGHAAAKGGRFGVVTELQKVSFDVNAQRLAAHISTNGEQTFTDDRYSVDLTFEAPVED